MKTKLITALRATASALEQDTFYYKWMQPNHCNCGALFCALTGLSASELDARIPHGTTSDESLWTTKVGTYCPITGMPNQELFKELFGFGLTARDIIDLEYLKNPKILERAGPLKFTTFGKVIDHTHKPNVIAYMRAWADLLTEEGAMDTAPVAQQEKVAHEKVL